MPDTTCAVFEMDKWGRNKRQISTPWEGLATLGVLEQSGEKRSSAEGIAVQTRRAGSRVAVHYRMNRPGPTTVTLYDLLGRPVAEQERHTQGGPHEEMVTLLEIPDLPNCIYLVIVRSQHAVGSGRFIYTR